MDSALREYKLRLLPYLEEGYFTTDGQVDILLECMEETKLIVLHMEDITIVKNGLQVSYFNYIALQIPNKLNGIFFVIIP